MNFFLIFAGCVDPTLMASAELFPGRVELHATRPVERVDLVDATGAPVTTRRLPTPSADVTVMVPWTPGDRFTATLSVEGTSVSIPVEAPSDLGPVRLTVAAPTGQSPHPVDDGESVGFVMATGGTAQVSISATALTPVTIEVQLGDTLHTRRLTTPGAHASFTASIADPTPVEVITRPPGCTEEVCTSITRFELRPHPVARGELAKQLRVVDWAFPADAQGNRDLARPADRIHVPSDWWLARMRGLGLGFRPRDPFVPWSHAGITLENRNPHDINAAITLENLDAQGRPAHAFRPRLRETDAGTGKVQVLVRVPGSGRVTAVLPVFVDDAALRAAPEHGLAPGRAGVGPGFSQVVSVTPLGADAPSSQPARQVFVTRGSPWMAVGTVLAGLASLGGIGLMLVGAPRWTRRARTSDLTTIALFGALAFAVNLVTYLLANGVGAVLGPFAILLTGLIDDTVRTCLFATLITLLPRRGVVTLAILVGFLLRGIALGSLGPVDLIFTGATIFYLECSLWFAGLTRGTAWRDQSAIARWLRLSVGFASASLLTTATGLVLQVVLYRLYFATWYVGLMLALPGFTYDVLACVLAVRFATSLRRVEA